MIIKCTAATLAILALGCAHAEDGASFKFGGFGTVSAVHSSERSADFVGNFTQPSGAGYASATSLAPDSKLAGQVDAQVSDKLSGVIQIIAKQQNDGRYTPNFEWAYIKYRLTPEWNVRIGRIAAPAFMVSEARLVGFANPMVRPPIELYGMFPATNSDGIDVSHRSVIGRINNTFQALYGGTSLKIPPENSHFKVQQMWGLNDMIESGALSLRAGYMQGKISTDSPGIYRLIGGLKQFSDAVASVPVPAYEVAASKAAAMSEIYKPEGIKASLLTLSANYDPGDWFLTGEVATFKSGGIISDSDGWSISGGYRLGSLTPYVALASTKAKLKPEAGVSTAGLDPETAAAAAALNGGIATVMNGFAFTQRNTTIGLRWDFMSNMALKAQFERLSLGANSAGRLGNLQPGFVPGGKLNVVSVAVDFVF